MGVDEAGLAGAVKLVVRTFLDEDHYKQLHRILSEAWAGEKALSAAVKLMKAHKMSTTKVEERLGGLSEEEAIDKLVSCMPAQSPEQFEHFYLQLSLIASTQARLREALFKGNTREVEEVLDAADDVGITPYILRMAVVQAGQEVKTVDEDQDDWIDTHSKKMAPLLSSQEDAMVIQRKLNAATAQIMQSRASASEKSRKVLMAVMGGQTNALLQSILVTWCDHVKYMKRENEVRLEYAEQIARAEQNLLDYTTKNMKGVKGVLLRKAAEDDQALCQLVFNTFRDDVEERKRDAAAGEEVKMLEEKLSSYAGAQAANTKKVMARMQGDSEAGLIAFIFQGWIQFSKEYKKNKEIEDEVKKAEARLAEFNAKNNAGAKSVLSRMGNASDTGLLSNVMTNWASWCKDEKQARELQEQFEANQARFGAFCANNKGAAGSAMQRAAEIQDEATCLTIFNAWRMHMKVEQKQRVGHEIHAVKKKQLHNVKGLFQSFASELDFNLKDVTPRHVDSTKQAPGRRQEAE